MLETYVFLHLTEKGFSFNFALREVPQNTPKKKQKCSDKHKLLFLSSKCVFGAAILFSMLKHCIVGNVCRVDKDKHLCGGKSVSK